MGDKWTQLIELRKAAGLSQYELARRLKMSRSALGNYEMGDREPDFETTKKLADFFGVSTDHLLGRRVHAAEDEPDDISEEWRSTLRTAIAEGYSPTQVLQALRLLEAVRRQQEENKKQNREG